MYLSETFVQKWAPVLDHPELAAIKDPYRKAVTAVILENQEKAMRDEANAYGNMFEAVPNSAGGGMSPVTGGEGNIKGFDPILIGLVRRALPNMMAYDVCGVQPMTGPTGLIFAMQTKYANTGNGWLNTAPEAFFNEANTAWSGTGSHATGVLGNAAGQLGNSLSTFANTVLANTGTAMATATGEDLGTGMAQMGFSIERVSVVAKTRALKAEYTLELAQDLKAIHGLDAEAELSNILSTEILSEINREVVRTIYAVANIGYLGISTNTFNLNSATDTSGRWAVEKFKGLLFAIERASNKIAKDTRRGKGNILIVSTDVASALSMTGLLDYQGALTNNTNLSVDDTGNTFAGTLFGRLKVYVDPYSITGSDFVIVGYKGATPYDAGLFYCPYVPLQMVRAINPDTFQPKIGFKTRYGLVQNPFGNSQQGADTTVSGALTNHTNTYYRKFAVTNLIG
jgi:Major capsid protein Gp23